MGRWPRLQAAEVVRCGAYCRFHHGRERPTGGLTRRVSHSTSVSPLLPSPPAHNGTIYLSRQWHPTPVLLPGKSHGWWAAVHEVAECRTQLSDFTFTFHFHALEKEMATHSSVLAWRIPGTGEPGELPSMGSHRVGHD